MKVDIVPFDAVGNEKWDRYVMNHPEGTLFHLSEWKSAIEKTFRHPNYYLAAVTKEDRERKIVGVLPMF